MLTMIGFSTSCAISISQDTRNTTTNATGSWVTRTIGNKDWEISTEGMVAFSTAASGGNSGSTGQLIHEIFENYLDDTSGTYNPRFLLVFSGAYATGDKYFQGYACISSLSIDASNQESATYSVSFVAAGPLEIITV
jgi:predicted secreted protein